MLQVGDLEKESLKKTIVANEANIKIQEGRLQHELDEKNRIINLKVQLADKVKTILQEVNIQSVLITPDVTTVEELNSLKQDVRQYVNEANLLNEKSKEINALLKSLALRVLEEEKESLNSLEAKLESETSIQNQYIVMIEEKQPILNLTLAQLTDLKQQKANMIEQIEIKKNLLAIQIQIQKDLENESIVVEKENQEIISKLEKESSELDKRLALSSEKLSQSKSIEAKLKAEISLISSSSDISMDEMAKQTADLDDEYSKTNAEKIQLMENYSNAKVLSATQELKLQNMREELVSLDKEIEKESIREGTLQNKFGFIASDSIASQLREKEISIENAKSETVHIRNVLAEKDVDKVANDQVKAKLIAILDLEVVKKNLLMQLKNIASHQDVDDEDLNKRLQEVLNQKEEIEKSIPLLRSELTTLRNGQKRVAELETEVKNLEEKLEERLKIQADILKKIDNEMKKLEIEKSKAAESKQREDELWVQHEIENRYNSELLQLTQKYTTELQQLSNKLNEEDSKFVTRVKEAEEKAEQEFLDKKARFLSILNSLKEFGDTPRTLNEDLLLEEVKDKTEMPAPGKKVKLNKKIESETSFEKECPVDNRDRLRLSSQSNSQVNSQKSKGQTKTYSSGRENSNPSTNIKTTKAASQSQPKKIDRTLNWMDSDDDDFGIKATKKLKVSQKNK